MTAASALASLDHIATASTSQAHAQSTRTLEDLQLWAQHAHASHLQWTSAHAIGPLRFDYAWGDGNTYGIGSTYTADSGVIHFNIENSF